MDDAHRLAMEAAKSGLSASEIASLTLEEYADLRSKLLNSYTGEVDSEERARRVVEKLRKQEQYRKQREAMVRQVSSRAVDKATGRHRKDVYKDLYHNGVYYHRTENDAGVHVRIGRWTDDDGFTPLEGLDYTCSNVNYSDPAHPKSGCEAV